MPVAAALDIPDDAELSEFAFPFYHAWQVIGSDRPIDGFAGCGRIPWSSIARYADIYFPGDLDALERLVRMLGALDDVYLTHQAEQMKLEQDKAKR